MKYYVLIIKNEIIHQSNSMDVLNKYVSKYYSNQVFQILEVSL